MTNLLFPTDFSTNTTVALDWARLLAHKTGATLTLLHVYQPMIPDSTLPTGSSDLGMGLIASQEVEHISQQRLTELATQIQTEGIPVRSEWRIGLVDDEILDVARELPADLIVMGRSDLNTFFDRLAGSAATEVADDATCPVLVVPVPADGHAGYSAQVRTIAYVMQAETTQSTVSAQTDSLVEAFGAHLLVLTEDQLAGAQADLIVIELHHKAGFLDNLIHPNSPARLIEKSAVPVLVYHRPK